MIVLITESLLQRSTATDGRILRDRFLQGFCVRLNKRKRTFLIATSVRGKQFRMMLGYWPLISVDHARSKAMEVLRQCRNGERPSRQVPQDLPTLRTVYVDYCKAKGIKPSSQRRYESFFRTHFGDWLDLPVDHMGHGAFAEHCNWFAQNTGNSLVELGRGVIFCRRCTNHRGIINCHLSFLYEKKRTLQRTQRFIKLVVSNNAFRPQRQIRAIERVQRK